MIPCFGFLVKTEAIALMFQLLLSSAYTKSRTFLLFMLPSQKQVGHRELRGQNQQKLDKVMSHTV